MFVKSSCATEQTSILINEFKMTPQIDVSQQIIRKIKKELNEVNNPVTLSHKFVELLKTCGQGNVNAYLAGFKVLYGNYTYYENLKSLILDGVVLAGIADHSNALEIL